MSFLGEVGHMKAARRLDSLPIYVFALLDAKLKAARAKELT